MKNKELQQCDTSEVNMSCNNDVRGSTSQNTIVVETMKEKKVTILRGQIIELQQKLRVVEIVNICSN